MEASLSGLPIVTTDVGIAGDILMNQVNSLICPVNDQKCLIESLSKLIRDEDLYKKLKENTLKISERLPSRPQYKYLEDYRKTITG